MPRRLVPLLLLAAGCPRAPVTVSDAPPSAEAPVDGAPAAAGAGWLRTPQFKLPVPPGYRSVDDARRAALAAQVGQTVDAVLVKPRARPEHFATSVVVTRVAGDAGDPADLASCRIAAAALTAATQTRLLAGPATVALPIGPTCQFEIGDERRRAIQTVVFAAGTTWTVTCNFDPRDSASPRECQAIVHGFAPP